MSVLPRQTARNMTVAVPGGARPLSCRADPGSARETYLAAALTSIFLTGSFFSVCRPTEIVRMPSW